MGTYGCATGHSIDAAGPCRDYKPLTILAMICLKKEKNQRQDEERRN
jgi:hypothetical protein